MNINRQSRRLAYLLRHDKEYQFEANGWRTVENLIQHYGFTYDLLDEIVAINNKQRYEYNDDKTKIRARQGHSVKVDVDLSETTPPDMLYHGTSDEVIDSILEEGIKSVGRLHVHLTLDIKTAINVGKRHGKPVVFKINAKRMKDDGLIFYLSRNGVWLTDYVAPKYISLIK